MIRFSCPTCMKVYQAEDEHAGRKTACKKCGALVIIPDAPVREFLYGKALPLEEEVEAIPESDPEPHRQKEQDSRHSNAFDRLEDDTWGDVTDGEDRGKRPRKPGVVTAMGGMLIGGGAWAILWAGVGCLFSTCLFCIWPGSWFAVVWAVLAIIRGSEILGARWYVRNPRILFIMQIILVVNLDIINVAMGIIGLVFLNDRRVRSSFSRRSW